MSVVAAVLFQSRKGHHQQRYFYPRVVQKQNILIPKSYIYWHVPGWHVRSRSCTIVMQSRTTINSITWRHLFPKLCKKEREQITPYATSCAKSYSCEKRKDWVVRKNVGNSWIQSRQNVPKIISRCTQDTCLCTCMHLLWTDTIWGQGAFLPLYMIYFSNEMTDYSRSQAIKERKKWPNIYPITKNVLINFIL